MVVHTKLGNLLRRHGCVLLSIGVLFGFSVTSSKYWFSCEGNTCGSSNKISAEVREEQNTSYTPHAILINAYMRSGSTFLGSLLGHQEDTFYFYEPLHDFVAWNYLKGDQLCSYHKPGCTEKSDMLNRSLDYLEDIFNCRLESHADKLREKLHTNEKLSGPVWANFKECRDGGKSSKQSCLKRMEFYCNQSKNRVMKTLRISLENAKLLLDRIPNLKIIHLFRDPRAIINSHINTNWYPATLNDLISIENDIIVNCDRIYNDIVAALILKSRYPDHILAVQYEDIDQSITKLEAIYKFIGRSLTPKVKEYIRSKIETKYNRSKGPNGVFTRISKYRQSLSYHIVKLIDVHCEKAIKLLGLRIYNSENEMKNQRVNSIVGNLPFSIS